MSPITNFSDVKPFVLLFGLVFLIVSAFIYSIYSKRYKLAKESDSWSQVQGVITKSEVKAVPIGRTQYKPLIEYKYNVNGINYSNDWVNIGNVFKNRKGKEEATEMVNDFSINSEVTIYYDSNFPNKSVLIPGLLSIHSTLRSLSIVMIITDFFLLALILAMYVIGI